MVFNLNLQTFFLVLVILTIWLGILSFLVYKALRHYNRLVQGTSRATLTEVLDKILGDLKLSSEQIDILVKRGEEQKKEGLTHIQKVGLIRFNPFEEVGGDQSFVLVLLNGENDGLVLTSLTSRTGTRWYAKKVSKGEGIEHELSKEEKEALRQAQGEKSTSQK